MYRRIALIVFALAGALALGAGNALADPVNNPHSAIYEVTCGSLEFTVVAPRGSAGHIVDGTGNLVLQSVEGVDPDFGPFSVQNPGLEGNGSLTTCTTTFTNELGHTFIATLGVLVTPRN
jgi:hypothetical protein